jgi:hypothetical protein
LARNVIVGARHAAPDASITTQLNEYGKIVEGIWGGITAYFPRIALGEFVVMPNHFHGILILDDPRGVRRAEPLRITPNQKP